MGEDREPHGEVDREDDQVLVRKLGILDDDHGEDDRREAAGAEPGEKAERRQPDV
jgi:hypothetical protein